MSFYLFKKILKIILGGRLFTKLKKNCLVPAEDTSFHQ